METLKNIIRNNSMCTRPEYYSGRGATAADLNYDILEGIYQGIEKEYGKDAATNYVKMVADIKVLSATTFLDELYMLFLRNWKYKHKRKHASGIAIQKNEDGEYDAMHGVVSIFTALFNTGKDDTLFIKGMFLSKHGIKPKNMKYCSDGHTIAYYY